MNILQALTEKAGSLDYGIRAKKLPYVNTLEVLGDSRSMILKAECGVGKTYSLRPLKELNKKVLYVSHRIALNEENQEYFTNTTCINSLPKYKLNEFDYIVFDEWTAMSSNFSWDQLKLNPIYQAISNYRHKLIFIDRDCDESSIQEISEFTNRKDFKYHHHETASREKPVLITKDINEFVTHIKELRGIKLIATDNATKAEQLANKDWGCEAKAITGKTTKIESIESVVAWAKSVKDCVIIMSPKIQEGTSFTGTDFVFNGYIMYGVEGLLLPCNKIYQATMRARDESVVRMVCIQTNDKEDCDEVPSSYDLFLDYLDKTNKLKEYIQLIDKRDVAETNAFREAYRNIFFKIYSNRLSKTQEQNLSLVESTQHEFEQGGFDVIVSPNKPCRRPNFAKKQKKQKPNINMTDEGVQFFSTMLKRNPNFLATCTGERHTNLKQLLEKPNLKPSDMKLEPNTQFPKQVVEHVRCQEQKELMANVHRLKRRNFIKGKFDELVNDDALLTTINEDKLKMMYYFEILNDLLNLTQLGDPKVKHLEFAKADLQAHAKYHEFMCMLKPDYKDTRVFCAFGRKQFGFQFKQAGKGKLKFKLLNDLKFSEELHYVELEQHIKAGGSIDKAILTLASKVLDKEKCNSLATNLAEYTGDKAQVLHQLVLMRQKA